jgi:hypothetical protein
VMLLPEAKIHRVTQRLESIFWRYFFNLPLPYWSRKMRHCATSRRCDVGSRFFNLIELMNEFFLLEPATHSCGPLYVGRQQRALLHWQDIIYQPVYRNGQAHRHLRLRGPRGGGGKTCRRSSRRSIAKRLLLAELPSSWCLFCEMEASTHAACPPSCLATYLGAISEDI